MKFKKVSAFFVGAFTLYVAICVGYTFWPQQKQKHKKQQLENQITTCGSDDLRYRVSDSPQIVSELNAIFRQPFYYLGEGKQCTAYVSRDGKNVLKFLLQKPLQVKNQFLTLPNFFPFSLIKSYKIDKRDERQNNLLAAFMLSYQLVPEQTATLYVHLNSSDNRFVKPLIIDTKGTPRVIDLDRTQFILQKRAQHIKPLLAELMWEGKISEAKERLDQILKLLFDCAKKGVIDLDQALIRNNNIGFVDSRAVYIDTGKLRLAKCLITKKEFARDLKRLVPLQRWLALHYPELGTYFLLRQKHFYDSFDDATSH